MKLEEGSEPSERWWLLESSNIKEAAAAEAVEAMAVAPTGSEWLCVPSYVVISMDMSSRHLWTYILYNTIE
jgi:stage V sporulation protein SpoVS